MPYKHAVSDRMLGQYPLSIATSLAIESANGVHPEIVVSKAPIVGYQQLWVNVRTLFRNLLESIDKQYVNGVMPDDLAHAISDEMDTIVSLINESSRGTCKVVFYFSNYRNMEGKYRNPAVAIRRDTTEKQLAYRAIHNNTMKLLLQLRQHDIVGVEHLVHPTDRPRALIVTHYAYDLLAHPKFERLALLESHTGKIKERAQWYTKYYNGKELVFIPFNEAFLQVFGDKETFHPSDIKLRKELIALAQKNKWTALTTHDKLMYNMDQLQNPYFATVMKDLLRASNRVS